MQNLSKKERRALKARALAVGLPENAAEAEIVAAEKAKGIKHEASNTTSNAVVNSNDVEEKTEKIFNLADTPTSDKATPNKQIETNPVKAWGKPA